MPIKQCSPEAELRARAELAHSTFERRQPDPNTARSLPMPSEGPSTAGKPVEIRQARTTVVTTDAQTILDAALADGVAYPHGCRSGRCGSCKSRLIAGEVEFLAHSRFALTDAEKTDGLILACRAIPRTAAVVAWLGDDGTAAGRRVEQVRGTVVSIDDATHDIKRVRISPAGGTALAFAAGQYAEVTFGSAPARSYSMANRPGDTHLEFHVRRVPGGRTSGHVHNRLKPGDAVTLAAPLGSSYLRENHAGPILCIAGGSGLAPIKSIVETALAHGMKQPIHVYFGARAERDLYLVEHFQMLEAWYPNLTFTPVLSDQAEGTRYRAGFVTRVAGEDLSRLDGWKAYVAGPPPMVDAAMETTFARGLRNEDMHADVFFTPEEERPPASVR